MNRLRLLLATIGTVGAAGVLLFIARPDVTPAELRAAGVDNCESTHVVCDILEGKGYHRRALAAWDCRDAGVGFILNGKKIPSMVEGSCELAAKDVAPPMELPLPCACRKKAGECNAIQKDGGMGPARFGRTLLPGWVGDGCERKVCTELAGSSSWPSACPGG